MSREGMPSIEGEYGKQPIDKISLTEDFRKYILKILEKEETFKEFITSENERQEIVIEYEKQLDYRIALDFVDWFKDIVRRNKRVKIEKLEKELNKLGEEVKTLEDEELWKKRGLNLD